MAIEKGGWWILSQMVVHWALVMAAKDGSGFDAPILDFLEHTRGCPAAAIACGCCRQTRQSLAWLLPWDQRGGKVFLLAPVIGKCKELVQEAGKDPKMAATRRRGRIPSLGQVRR
jgi:hypothetical protein